MPPPRPLRDDSNQDSTFHPWSNSAVGMNGSARGSTCHGSETTLLGDINMMLWHGPNDLVLIDFGLSYHSAPIEDKAADPYVLERAFASTHPDSEPLLASVLAAYGVRMGSAVGFRQEEAGWRPAAREKAEHGRVGEAFRV
ncbi:hypothetical protein BV22DRAFT_1133873 [Leucogyrophana mollusca]|uniref:Uncharacterized protein n=1 Tax=Leucogyrophana mollusca TaxID=85980 RepID=A0ACB8B1D5_9AGAM|nr:hypothetical protein BV22DRAFT_1133873 [Leucogyrophana mollusca]